MTNRQRRTVKPFTQLIRLGRLTVKRLNADRRGIQIVVRALGRVHQQPLSAWRRIELESIARAYRTPRILDGTIKLRDYQRPSRLVPQR
jgi:hypothetical protein